VGEEKPMSQHDRTFTLAVQPTRSRCPVGEATGVAAEQAGQTPVYSCEGACIRGEIARRAANLVAREGPYRRGCHGELFTVPGSAIARWTRGAEKVVLIDGCFLRCHGRIMEDLLGAERLVQFDALSHYKKYTDIFDIDDEIDAVARRVADWVLGELARPAGARRCAPGRDPAIPACGG